ncbi:MAG: hypothetical protein KDK41_01555 [Leptospiraceae bacterium]|nr:hypothetical protein [Leptospiraceae bacterium]
MIFEGEDIRAERVAELAQFGTFLGGLKFVCLKEPVVDDKKNILVAAGRSLREGILNALYEREKGSPFNLTIEKNQQLKDAVQGKVIREIEDRISLSNFSFPAYMIHTREVDVPRLVRGSLNNTAIFNYLCSLMYNNRPILGHLIEVALTSVGLLADSMIPGMKSTDFLHVFMAGLMHDAHIVDLQDWFHKENFEGDTDNGHDGASASKISQWQIPEHLPDMIRDHNRLRKIYAHTTRSAKERWYTDVSELCGAIINMVEYFTFLRRKLTTDRDDSEEKKDEFGEILYQMSYQTEQGFFPKPLIVSFERHFQKYEKFFRYGENIAAIEAKCKFKHHAMAYPKPRSTQVLCKDHTQECPFRLSSNPINIINTENKVGSRFKTQLAPGWYDKCQLTDDLPTPPFTI